MSSGVSGIRNQNQVLNRALAFCGGGGDMVTDALSLSLFFLYLSIKQDVFVGFYLSTNTGDRW